MDKGVVNQPNIENNTICGKSSIEHLCAILSHKKESQRHWNVLKNAKPYWDSINKLTDVQFSELINCLTDKDEDLLNPSGVGRPGKVRELARAILYDMTEKQQQVAYKIIKQRFNKLGDIN